jgi:hypothetical protein
VFSYIYLDNQIPCESRQTFGLPVVGHGEKNRLWITFVGWALQALQALIARASTQRLRAPETMRCRVF